MLTGLVRYSSAPYSTAFIAVLSSGLPVIRTTGRSASRSWMARKSSTPSMSGMHTSLTMRSKSWFSAYSTASRPLAASTTWWPSAIRVRRRALRSVSLSSTKSTRPRTSVADPWRCFALTDTRRPHETRDDAADDESDPRFSGGEMPFCGWRWESARFASGGCDTFSTGKRAITRARVNARGSGACPRSPKARRGRRTQCRWSHDRQ